MKRGRKTSGKKKRIDFVEEDDAPYQSVLDMMANSEGENPWWVPVAQAIRTDPSRMGAEEAIEDQYAMLPYADVPDFGPDKRSYQQRMVSYMKQMISDPGAFVRNFEPEQTHSRKTVPYFLFYINSAAVPAFAMKQDQRVREYFKSVDIPASQARILKKDTKYYIKPLIANEDLSEFTGQLDDRILIPGLYLFNNGISPLNEIVAISAKYMAPFVRSPLYERFKPLMFDDLTNIALIDQHKYPQYYHNLSTMKAEGRIRTRKHK